MNRRFNRYLAICGLIAASILSVATHANEQLSAANLEGRWEGALDTGQGKLRLVLEISQGSGDAVAGTLISVDQGGARIPIASIDVHGNSLRLDVKVVNGNFEGTINDDKSHITGTWTQGLSLPLEFIRVSTTK